jgi:hypothetical protein
MTYKEMVALRERLRSHYTIFQANRWMLTPHILLRNKAPVMCEAGEVSQVISLLEALDEF